MARLASMTVGGDPSPLSVTELTRRVKAALEDGVPACWVRGEVTNLRPYPSGHIYFSLKDAGAQISAVIFKGDAGRLSAPLKDGAQVVVQGSLSVYEARGQYQLIVRTVIDDGVGRLQREFEALKKRLSEEGIFDAARKVPIPEMPSTVGFVTSPSGAAVQDFLRILSRREWRGRVVVIPAKVQGEGSAQEMAEALGYAESLGIFDLLVIGRGGGSLEDLWAFNEEVLVRAVAACQVPIVSAVGHEIDFTLCDFAADVRAETPSAAAELISSHFVSSLNRLETAQRRCIRAIDTEASRMRQKVLQAKGRLRLLSPSGQVQQGHLRLDDLQNRLEAAMLRTAARKRTLFDRVAATLAHRSPQRRFENESQRLLALWKRLQAASPQSVLNRGFAMIVDETGKPLQRAAEISPGQQVKATFADGDVSLRA